MAKRIRDQPFSVTRSSAHLLFGDSHGAESSEIDPGIPVCGVGGRMAQDIGDCLEWTPVSQQPCGKCVAEQVYAPPTSSSGEASALKGTSHVRYQVVLRRERLEWRTVPQEDGAEG
jgi:hypothetical protein